MRPAGDDVSDSFCFGVIADTHFGHLNPLPARPRYYRLSLENTLQTMQLFNRRQAKFVVNLGDVIQESGSRTTTMDWLSEIDVATHTFHGPVHYAVGNHDLIDLSKDDFLAATPLNGIQSTHYYFDESGFRFFVLDPNYKENGEPYDHGNFTTPDTWLSDEQMQWLDEKLDEAKDLGLRAAAFAHQCFDSRSEYAMVKNAPEVRALFEQKGNVEAVLYGHRHNGGYECINGIHYLNLFAAVNGPDTAAGLVTFSPRGAVMLEGVGIRQPSWLLRSYPGARAGIHGLRSAAV